MPEYWQCRCKTCGIVGASKTLPEICPKCEKGVARIKGIDHSYSMHWTRVGSDEQELFDKVRRNATCPSIGPQNVCRAHREGQSCSEPIICEYPAKPCSWQAKMMGGKR